jgi:hypothetical protein
MSRPTKCTQEITDEICQRIADGESLRSVCRDEHLPEKATVLLWVVNNRTIEDTERQFFDQYHRARTAGGFSHADEAMDLRHEVRGGEIEPNAAKVILDALKWGAERMAPKYHSQRQEIDHSSEDGSMTPKESIDPSKLSDAALQELMDARSSESD